MASRERIITDTEQLIADNMLTEALGEPVVISEGELMKPLGFVEELTADRLITQGLGLEQRSALPAPYADESMQTKNTEVKHPLAERSLTRAERYVLRETHRTIPRLHGGVVFTAEIHSRASISPKKNNTSRKGDE